MSVILGNKEGKCPLDGLSVSLSLRILQLRVCFGSVLDSKYFLQCPYLQGAKY